MQQIFEKIKVWIGQANEADNRKSKYIDLAPTDAADEAGVYSEALLYATSNPRVSNIALTGPYGSGKSSIIKSFLKKYKRPVLQISLAAFLPEAMDTAASVGRQEIERSILQQMLYGADADKLPRSRFKRIQTPSGWSVVKSVYIVFGIFACWYLFQQRLDIVSGAYFLPFELSNWFHFTCLALGVPFLCFVAHYLYVMSLGVSLKSISLKDIELAPKESDKDSILNRHLDEIIYFFQTTKYELVVVEDLDRFNNSEIFVTLREINSLVNENSGVKHKVRFLYALRDDMFLNTDRTKFFEFIIPVIPIVNSSNSIDKVLEQGKRLDIDKRLDRQFLREVSRYLNDMRLIQNIFNEYAVYVANLETDGDNVLDENKLLAVLIYKNIFPSDFEKLHRGTGKLAQILDRHDDLIAQSENKYKAEIARLEIQNEFADEQVAKNVHDLRRIYAMALLEKLPNNVIQVGLNHGNLVDVLSISRNGLFDQIIEQKQVFYRNNQGYNQHKNIVDLQAEVDPDKTYKERKAEIEQRSIEFKNATAKKINELRVNLSKLRASKFNHLILLNTGSMDDLFEKFEENEELARFLILEGYLDDTYYQYTSLFHSGRLSPSDNKFLIQIRAFVTPAPNFQIDNAKEVIAAMRDEDFRQDYVLNVKIVDCLLGEQFAYASQKAKLFEYLRTNFDKCDAFFAAYYATGTQVTELVSQLAKSWAGFVPAAIANPKNLMHVTQIIANFPERELEDLRRTCPELTEFVSVNLPQILALEIDFDPVKLKRVEVEIKNLPAVGTFAGVARFLFEEGLYKLTIENVEFIFNSIFGVADLHPLRTRNYSTIVSTDSTPLHSRIERGFSDYFDDILLKLEENSQESISTILSVIARDDIELDGIAVFLNRQAARIPSLGQASARVHALLFDLAKVEATWANCVAFIASESFKAESLTTFLGMRAVQATLIQQAIPTGQEALALRRFLFDCDALPDDMYRSYIRILPTLTASFPKGLSAGKAQILIEERKVTFSADNLASLQDEPTLQVLFVAKNIERYFTSKASFSLDDEFLERLIESEISNDQKLAIIKSMDLSLLVGLPSRARSIGPILNRSGADMTFLDADSARAVILNSAPITVQISLLNKSKGLLRDEDVREILTMLPTPFNEIKKSGYSVRINNTEENRELVTWLDERNIISSWSEGYFGDEIRINLFRR